MTRRALITEAELLRMARVAKREGVRVGCEIEGRIFWVTPDHPDVRRPVVEQLPDDFAF